jgi:tetrahydromethanopterin S-methyltransferase subunit D
MNRYIAAGAIAGAVIGGVGGELLLYSKAQDIRQDVRSFEECRDGTLALVETEIAGRFACNDVIVMAVGSSDSPSFYWESTERGLNDELREVSDNMARELYGGGGTIVGAALGGATGLITAGLEVLAKSIKPKNLSSHIHPPVSPLPE